MLNLVYNGHISIGRLSTRILGRDKAIVSSQLRSARRISSSPGSNARTHLSLRIAFGYDPHVRHCFRLVSSERLQCFSRLPQENSLFQTGRRTTSDARTNSASWQSAFSVSVISQYRACGSAAASFVSSPEGNKEHNRHQQQHQQQQTCQSFRIGWQRRS